MTGVMDRERRCRSSSSSAATRSYNESCGSNEFKLAVSAKRPRYLCRGGRSSHRQLKDEKLQLGILRRLPRGRVALGLLDVVLEHNMRYLLADHLRSSISLFSILETIDRKGT